MRVLVTGGTGLLGTWLHRAAPAGVHVTACARCCAPPVDLREPGAAQRAVAESGAEALSRHELGVRLERALGVSGLSTTQPAPPSDARPHDLRLRGARAERAIGWAPAPVP